MMSEEDEVEKFEITDYDLATEFNPGRFRKKQSKKSATYGVFAPDSDDDTVGHLGFSKERKNYTTGVAFISAGIQKPAEKQNEDDANDKHPEISDTSSEDEFEVVSKSYGRGRMIQDFRQIAGLRRSTAHDGSGKATGSYGIGEKMALKMGYQPGKGLGKDLQGIAAPIEAVVRKGRGAIGAYGKEAKVKPAESLFPTLDTPQKKVVRENKWKKNREGGDAVSSASKKDTVEYRYITADEVLEQRQLHIRPDAGVLAKTKVIDMTGSETRILSGYHAISGQKRPEDEWEDSRRQEDERLKLQQKTVFDIPELIHNVNLLLDTCEQNILKNDKKAKYAADRKVVVQEEEVLLKRTIQMEEIEIITLEDLIQEIKILDENESSLDLENSYIALGKLKCNHQTEWELYELYTLVPALVVPLMKTQLNSVNLFASSDEVFGLFYDWRSLLGGHLETFDTIIWEAWMPMFRPAFGFWNVKDADTMLNVVEKWKSILPGWIYQNILEQMILPKINEGVEAWDPLSDNIPIHAWIHPWLPILGAKLEIVYPTIRRKLSNALVHWHPSDTSGKQILTPWVTVFSQGSMDVFLLKNIMPKLQVAMQQLVINPAQQILDQWNWVMDWADLIPTKAIVTLLEKFFFPKWHQFLITWLNQRPNYDEVFRWYTWWRGIFPEKYMQDIVVTDNVQKALQIINAAVQAPGKPMDFSYILLPNQQIVMPQQLQMPIPMPMITPQVMADAIRMTAQVPNGFRDLVQMKCEELGLLFIPIPHRYYEGKQVYKCGNALIYISANVIYIQKDGMWSPTSLQQMIHFASS